MTAWRKEEVDAARHLASSTVVSILILIGDRRGSETGKVVIAHGSVEFCEATSFDLIDESKESLLYRRETDRDLCIAPACRCVT